MSRVTEVRGQPAGFTLLEVLVAFIIAALALGLLFQGGIGGLLTARIAGRYGEALSRAESHLAEATAGPTLTAGDSSGAEGGGFRWRVRIQPIDTAPVIDKTKPVLALYAVDVLESWVENGRTRAVSLQTQRTATAPAPPP